MDSSDPATDRVTTSGTSITSKTSTMSGKNRVFFYSITRSTCLTRIHLSHCKYGKGQKRPTNF